MKYTFLIAIFGLATFSFPASLEAGQKLNASQKIDRIIKAGYKEHGVQPNPMASDEVFVRRIYLDVIGRVPTMAETVTFLESKNPNKRARLIDELLNSDGYVSHHYNYWADILRAKSRLNGNGQSLPAGYAFEKWIKDSLRENKPYDQFVKEMVSASGNSWENGAVGYYIRDFGMPLDNLAITTQVFLGTQIVCAQCHDHPFDKWTQMDYYQLSAFTYGKVTSNNSPNQREALAFLQKRKKKVPQKAQQDVRRAFSEILRPVRFNAVYDVNRKLRLPHDYQYDDAKPRSLVDPETPFGPEAPLSGADHPSEAFAEWLTSEQNDRFTTVIANRLWKKAFGVGIYEPVDELTHHSQPSNPELMAFLEARMKGFDYDMKKFLRMVYNTEAYQRESSREAVTLGLPYHYPGPILRRMSAEQIWDSLVAMAVDNPDAPSPAHELEIKKQLTEVQLVAEAIYDQKPGEFLRNAHEIAQVQKRLAGEIEQAQKELADARASKDPKRIREAISEVGKIRRQLAIEVEKQVYREALEEKIEMASAATGSGNFLADLSSVVTAGGDQTISEGMETYTEERRGLIDPLVKALLKEEADQIRADELARRERETAEWNVGKKQRPIYNAFANRREQFVRSSELRSPAPPGHFLREFGQSDREVVENANDQASITQALAMLNGPTINAITHPYSVLGREMKGQTYRERLDTIYLTMLSRKPTDEERKIFAEAFAADPEAGSVTGIVWTILNMRQFLFVQ
ncbi:MAG: DUF1549 domain-containing protein [Verrucomicrobiales bacterium]|nr:DUF1549 domain-containing protein [Verrucomicrobiales bacterium]